MISLVVVLLMLCLWDRLHETSGQLCVDQPPRTESIEGKSVTIPCQFSFPESENNIKFATIIVRASDQYFCRGDNAIIHDSSKGSFSPKYRGRLNVTFDQRHKNASITINNVKKEDATRYCCRLELSFIIGENMKWQSPDGTLLTVKDRNDPGLETTPVIFAAPGDNVTLQGHFISNNLTSASDVTCHVRRTADRATRCDLGANIGGCTYKNNSLSFQINQVTSENNAFYCWQVHISTNNEEKNTYYYLGPQLLIIVPDPKLIPQHKLSPIATIVLCVVLVFLVIFISLAIYFLKKRGSKQNSIGETIVETMEMTDDQNGGYENPTIIRRQQEGEDLVYSTVNHSKSSMRKNTKGHLESLPAPTTETVYAEVRKS
ncbi:uncharacterized protein LOC143961374 isoform X3 [Lithobates pipiens]